jgi:hypothetical protein
MPETDRHFVQEICVFEAGQHAEIDADTQRYPQFFPDPASHFGNYTTDEKIGSRRRNQEYKPQSACFVIKINGKKNHIYDSYV